jgi:membrane protein required for colicin V production
MNWIDFTILFILVLAFLNGYRRGAFKEISTLLGVIVGIIFAVNNADWLAGQLRGKFNFSPTVLYMISYIMMLAAGMAILKLLGHFFYKLVKIAPLKTPNKITGGVFGVIKGLVVVSLVLLLFLFPTPFRSIDGAIESSATAKPIRGFVPVIYNHTYVVHPRSGDFFSEVDKGISGPTGPMLASNSDDNSSVGVRPPMTPDDDRTLSRLRQYSTEAEAQTGQQ